MPHPHRKKNRRARVSRSHRRLRRAAPIEYESLEPRLALTTFVVNALGDDPTGTLTGISLREAIIAANTNAPFGQAPAGSAGGDVIQFDPSLAGGTFVLTGGQLSITDDLLVHGGGLGMTIDAGGNSRIFEINSSERVAVGGFTLTGGSATVGGAINSIGSGTTILVGLNLNLNVATGQGGGAIFHQSGNLFISDSNFTGNRASGVSGSGGAILSASGLTSIFNGRMESNTANRAGGAIEVIAGRFRTSNTLVGTVGKGNIAGPSGSAAPGNGGGLHVSGAAEIVISGGKFTENFAALEGGGLWNQSGATMYLRGGAQIVDNTAAGNAADDGGGGIFNNGGDLFLNNAKVNSNDARGTSGSGGGIFSTAGRVLVIDSTIKENAAVRAGGGVEIVEGILVITNSNVQSNTAGVVFTANPGSGAGVHMTGSATIVVDGGTVSDNRALNEGGGLWNQSTGKIYLRNGAEISRNSANGDAADEGGGGIYNNGGSVYVTNSTIRDNAANGLNGSGGGIFSSAGVVLATNSTISNNAAARAGGGVEVIEGLIRLNNSVVSYNNAGVTNVAKPGNGGAIHTTGTATVYVVGGEFVDNRAANQGGAFWIEFGANLFLQNGTQVRGNTTTTANSVAGGVYTKGYLSALDSFFIGNHAESLGGAFVLSTTGRAKIVNTEFRSNTAGVRGGALNNFGIANIQNSTFRTNIAGFSGGAYFTNPGAKTVGSGNSFNGNLPNNSN